MTEPLDRDDVIKLMAALISGLQVPVSMFPNPRVMLGAAYEPWAALFHSLGPGIGWTDAEEMQEALREVFNAPIDTPAKPG